MRISCNDLAFYLYQIVFVYITGVIYILTFLESLIDPSRNHRSYRMATGKMSPPYIPFMPLVLKDMTFTHEGNKTWTSEGLVSFEKMHMLSSTIRGVKYARSRQLCKF